LAHKGPRRPVGIALAPRFENDATAPVTDRAALLSAYRLRQFGICAVISTLNSRPWLGTRKWMSS
jgi:hypothetical protein